MPVPLIRLIAILMVALSTATAQNDWPVNGHEAGNTRYSPLAQVNTQNIGTLGRAWTYHTGDEGRQFESTPLMVGGVLYVTTQNQRVVALEPETGREIWKFDPKVRRPREHRGVAYWPGDQRTPARLLMGTADGRLIALDAKSGTPVAGFGDNGTVNLRVGVADQFPSASYAISSPPAIYKNLVIVGPSTQEGPGRGPSGDPRAFDVRTGRLVWRFHTVPQPGEPGNDTWGPDGWKDRSGPSLWGTMAVDGERGLVFLATGNPADSFYGGDRKGTNLYANCVIALEAATGKLRWYYQVVHHDIFDYDLPGAPSLVEAVRDGKRVAAVAQITKSGLLFVLDRETGRPVFGVEERAVPKSDVPGESAWPTQPFPVKPPPLARNTITRAEIFGRTPEAERYCLNLFDQTRHEGPYTPYSTGKTTLLFPGAMGGGNWGGVSFDPSLEYIFVNTSNLGAIGHLVPAPEGSGVGWRNESGYARFLDPDGYPCQQPPWGELTAVNAATGDIAWRVPLGSFEDMEVRGFPHAGTPNVGGTLATAGGLVFVAATNDARIRAFESRTGKEVWSAKLDATGNASPITYRGRDGKQYVVIAAGGPGHLRNVGDNTANVADTLIAFALGATGGHSESTAARVPARPGGTGVPVTASLPEGEGKALVERVCGQCHGMGTVTGQKMTRQQWDREVGDMVARGAVATDEEIGAIVNYLARHFARE